jgi:DNA-binding response OmpR family regulator
MYPKSLALLEDDVTYAEYLARHLAGLGVRVSSFLQAENLLEAANGLVHDFYVVDLMLPGLDGVQFIRRLREFSSAGVLVVSGRTEQHVFADVVKAGADMYLAKPVSFEQAVLAIEAVHRRSRLSLQGRQPWRLDAVASELLAPGGVRISLSEGDLVVLKALSDNESQTVTRLALCGLLGYPDGDQAESALNAAIFRLRRRIERATGVAAPLHARSRLGYEFRAPLVVL